MSKNIHYKDKYYKSVRLFYEENKDDIEVSYEKLLENLRSGLNIEKAINTQPRKKGYEQISKFGKFIVEGTEYLNLRQLAEEYEMNINTMFQRHHRGLREDDLIPLKKRKKYVKPITKKEYRYFLENKGFNSYHEISEYYNVKTITIRKRLERGLSLEQAVGIIKTPDFRIKNNKSEKVNRKAGEVELLVDGIKYKSISQLAKSFNMTDTTLRKRILEQGLSPEKAVKRPIKKRAEYSKTHNLYVDGVQYKNITELAKAYNLKYDIVYQRVNNYGYSPEEAVKKPLKGQDIFVEGKTFKSIAEAARFYNKPPANVQSNLKNGQSIEEALGLKKSYARNSVFYEWNDQKYTIDELTTYLSKEYKIPKKLLFSRINNSGLSIEEAIELGSSKVVGSGRYNLTILKRDPELANKKAELYFVLIKKESKTFYKIGITTKTTRERLAGEDHKILSTNKGKLIEMYTREQYLLDKFKDNKAGDNLEGYFDGKTELLNLNSKEVEEVLNYLNQDKL